MEHIPHEYQNAAMLNLQRLLQVRKGSWRGHGEVVGSFRLLQQINRGECSARSGADYRHPSKSAFEMVSQS